MCIPCVPIAAVDRNGHFTISAVYKESVGPLSSACEPAACVVLDTLCSRHSVLVSLPLEARSERRSQDARLGPFVQPARDPRCGVECSVLCAPGCGGIFVISAAHYRRVRRGAGPWNAGVFPGGVGAALHSYTLRQSNRFTVQQCRNLAWSCPRHPGKESAGSIAAACPQFSGRPVIRALVDLASLHWFASIRPRH